MGWDFEDAYLSATIDANNRTSTICEKKTIQKTHEGLSYPHIHLLETMIVAYDYHLGGWQ